MVFVLLLILVVVVVLAALALLHLASQKLVPTEVPFCSIIIEHQSCSTV